MERATRDECSSAERLFISNINCFSIAPKQPVEKDTKCWIKSAFLENMDSLRFRSGPFFRRIVVGEGVSKLEERWGRKILVSDRWIDELDVYRWAGGG